MNTNYQMHTKLYKTTANIRTAIMHKTPGLETKFMLMSNVSTITLMQVTCFPWKVEIQLYIGKILWHNKAKEKNAKNIYIAFS